MNRQKGFTLVEMLLVLGLITVITLAAYMYMSKRTDYAKADLNSTLISQTVSKIQYMVKGYNLKSNLPATQNSINQMIAVNNLIQNKVLPDELITGNQAKTTFGSIITFNTEIATINTTGSPAGVDSILLNVSFTALSVNNCIDSISNRLILENSSRIKIGGTTVKNFGDRTVSASQIGTACATNQNIVLSYILYESTQSTTSTEQCTDCGNSRSAEDLYHVTTGVVNATPGTTAPVCGTDSSWSTTNSVCVCNAANKQWNGEKCVTIWTQGSPNNSGYCPLGYGWDRSKGINSKCVKLPDQTNGQTQAVREQRLINYLNQTIPANKYYRPVDPVLYPVDLAGKKPADLINVGATGACPTCLNPNININSGASGVVTAPDPIAANPTTLSANYTTNAGRYIPPSIPLSGAVDFKSNQSVQQVCNLPVSGSPVNVPRTTQTPSEVSSGKQLEGYDGSSCQQCILSGGYWDTTRNRCQLSFDNDQDKINSNPTNAIKDVKVLDSCIRSGLKYTYNAGTNSYVCQ